MTDMQFTLLLILSVGITFIAQMLVKSRYAKYSQVATNSRITGADVARKILDANGMSDVPVVATSGTLTDNYNPSKRTVNLSEGVYGASTVAGIAVAAHECGHAIQHHTGYSFLRLRTSMVPVVNLSSKVSYALIVAGAVLGYLKLYEIGIILESVAVAFHMVTLPVEFDASRRGLKQLEDFGVFDGTEMEGCKKMLTAAALTYVGAALSAIVSMLRLLLQLNNSKRERR